MRKHTHQISIKSYSQILHQSLTIEVTAVLAKSLCLCYTNYAAYSPKQLGKTLLAMP